jgi:hypothetical protein
MRIGKENRYEFINKTGIKKSYWNKAVKIACCMVLFYIFVAFVGSIGAQSFSIYNKGTQIDEEVRGLKAIKVKKQLV